MLWILAAIEVDSGAQDLKLRRVAARRDDNRAETEKSENGWEFRAGKAWNSHTDLTIIGNKLQAWARTQFRPGLEAGKQRAAVGRLAALKADYTFNCETADGSGGLARLVA